VENNQPDKNYQLRFQTKRDTPQCGFVCLISGARIHDPQPFAVLGIGVMGGAELQSSLSEDELRELGEALLTEAGRLAAHRTGMEFMP